MSNFARLSLLNSMVASGVCSCCAAVADLFCCSVIAMEMQFTRVRLNAEGEGPQPFCPTKEEVRCQIMPLMHARDFGVHTRGQDGSSTALTHSSHRDGATCCLLILLRLVWMV